MARARKKLVEGYAVLYASGKIHVMVVASGVAPVDASSHVCIYG